MKSQLLLSAEIERLQRALKEWDDPIPSLEVQAGLWQTRDGHIVAVNDEQTAFVIRTQDELPLPYSYLVNERGEYDRATHINQRGLDLAKPLNLLE